jgi:hypothetical protein
MIAPFRIEDIPGFVKSSNM